MGEQDGTSQVNAASVQRVGAKSTKSRVLGLLQIFGIVALVGMAIWFSREDKGGSAPSEALMAASGAAPNTQATPTYVAVVLPEAQPVRVEVGATGSVAVRNYLALTPQVSGRIQSLSPALRVGGEFAANQELLRIDPADYELALAQANADLASARANLLLLQAQRDAAVTNYALLNGNKPVPPLVAKQPQILQGQAQIEAAQARVSIAKLNLTRTKFSLPFAGKVTATTAEVGQLLAQGQSFGQAFANDSVEIVVPIATADLELLQPAVGRMAQIRTEKKSLSAKVVRQAAQLDERTRFSRLFLQTDRPELIPGTFAQVTLYGPQVTAALALPVAAEQADGRVWTVRAGSLAAVTPDIIYRNNQQVFVQPFVLDDGIVVGTVAGGFEGMPVQIAADG